MLPFCEMCPGRADSLNYEVALREVKSVPAREILHRIERLSQAPECVKRSAQRSPQRAFHEPAQRFAKMLAKNWQLGGAI